jgi:hypothetical protein
MAPRIEAIETTPANYKFPAPTPPPLPSQSLTLPPMGKAPAIASVPVDSVTPSMQCSKGFIGARWSATDDNSDSLAFTVEIRDVSETKWQLRQGQREVLELGFDSFPHGELSHPGYCI